MNVVALTSFLRGVKCAESVRVLVGLIVGRVRGARHVQESVGAARLGVRGVLSGWRAAASGRLPAHLRRGLGIR